MTASGVFISCAASWKNSASRRVVALQVCGHRVERPPERLDLIRTARQARPGRQITLGHRRRGRLELLQRPDEAAGHQHPQDRGNRRGKHGDHDDRDGRLQLRLGEVSPLVCPHARAPRAALTRAEPIAARRRARRLRRPHGAEAPSHDSGVAIATATAVPIATAANASARRAPRPRGTEWTARVIRVPRDSRRRGPSRHSRGPRPARRACDAGFDVAVDRAVVGVIGLAKHALAEAFPGPRDAWDVGERQQQVELRPSEAEVGGTAADLARRLVDLEVEVAARLGRHVLGAAGGGGAGTGDSRRSTAPTRATSRAARRAW